MKRTNLPRLGRLRSRIVLSAVALAYVSLLIAQNPVIVRIINPVTGDNRLAPGSLATVIGFNLDCTSATSCATSASDAAKAGPFGTVSPVAGDTGIPGAAYFSDSRQLSATTAPTSVYVNGLEAGVIQSSPNSLTVQLPYGAQPGPANVSVEWGERISNRLSFDLQRFAPTLMLSDIQDAFFRQYFDERLPAAKYGVFWDSRAINSVTVAAPGQEIVVDAQGLGAVRPTLPPGTPAPFNPLPLVEVLPNVVVGNVPVTARSANLKPGTVGIYQVRFVVPSTLATGMHVVTVGMPSSAGTLVSNPVLLGVNAAVSTRASLQVSPTALSFSGRAGGAAPAPQRLNVTSSDAATRLSFVVTTEPSGSWLSVNRRSGETPGTIDVSVDTGNLAAGVYSGSLLITGTAGSGSAGAPAESRSIPVTFSVSAAEVRTLTVSPSSLQFRAQQGSASVTAQTLVVDSNGDSTTVAAQVVSGGAWLRVRSSSGATPARFDVEVNPQGLAPDFYSGMIQISGDGIPQRRQIPVTLEVVPAETSALSVNPTNVVFRWYSGSPQPAPQTIRVQASAGTANYVVNWRVNSGPNNWLTASTRNITAPGNFDVRASAIGAQVGTYTGEVTLESQGTVRARIPVQFQVTPPTPPRLAAETQGIGVSGPRGSGARTVPLTIRNESPEILNFNIRGVADDGGNWLTVNKGEKNFDGAAENQPAIAMVGLDPGDLPPGTYTGKVIIESDASGDGSPKQTLVVPVAFAVSPRPVDLAVSHNGQMFFQAVAGSDALPLDLSVLAFGRGDINLQTKVTRGSDWLSVSQSSGTVSGGGAPFVLDVNASARGKAPGEYSGMIEITGDNGAAPLYVTVVLRVSSDARSLGPTVSPASMAFTASTLGARRFVISAPGSSGVNISAVADPQNPVRGTDWIRWDVPQNINRSATGEVNVSFANLPPGQYRATLTLVFSGGSVAILQILAVNSGTPSATAAGRHSTAECRPSQYLPLFTTTQPKFSQLLGAPLATEVVIVDDCGNVVTDAAVASSFSSRDRPLTLEPLGSGRWRATWVPRVPDQGEVRLETLSSDTRRQLSVSSANVTAYMSGSSGVPRLSADRGITDLNGILQRALAPGSVFRIAGENLASGSESAGSGGTVTSLRDTSVLLGGTPLILRSVAPDQIIAVVPADMEFRGESQLVVAQGENLSAPEPVLVVNEWATLQSIRETPEGRVEAVMSGVDRVVRLQDLHTLQVSVDEQTCTVSSWTHNEVGVYRALLNEACRLRDGAVVQVGSRTTRTGARLHRAGHISEVVPLQ